MARFSYDAVRPWTWAAPAPEVMGFEHGDASAR